MRFYCGGGSSIFCESASEAEALNKYEMSGRREEERRRRRRKRDLLRHAS